MPVRGHSWDYWDAKLTSQGDDKETRGSIIGKWEQEESKEADTTSLQPPKGKENPKEAVTTMPMPILQRHMGYTKQVMDT